MMLTKASINELTYNIIGAAIEVHKQLGPGLLESIYHRCMMEELNYRKLNYMSQPSTPVRYRSIELDTDLRCDLFVENCIAVELKSIEAFAPIHQAIILTYMKLLHVPEGVLINFNVTNIFKFGQQTFVNELFSELPDE